MRNNLLQVVIATMLLTQVAEAQSRPVRSQPEGGTVRSTAEEAVAEGQRLLARRTAALLYDYSGAKEAAQQALTLDDERAMEEGRSR
jgi:hypothetical protein